ncbi:hypothetical protein ACFX2I_025950 [Malus domestica]
MIDSQSYSWNSVRLEGETIQVLTQEQSTAMPYNINANINVWVAQRGCDSKVPVKVHLAATVDVLKAIISEHQRHLDFNLPAHIFWNLFHAHNQNTSIFNDDWNLDLLKNCRERKWLSSSLSYSRDMAADSVKVWGVVLEVG